MLLKVVAILGVVVCACNGSPLHPNNAPVYKENPKHGELSEEELQLVLVPSYSLFSALVSSPTEGSRSRRSTSENEKRFEALQHKFDFRLYPVENLLSDKFVFLKHIGNKRVIGELANEELVGIYQGKDEQQENTLIALELGDSGGETMDLIRGPDAEPNIYGSMDSGVLTGKLRPIREARNIEQEPIILVESQATMDAPWAVDDHGPALVRVRRDSPPPGYGAPPMHHAAPTSEPVPKPQSYSRTYTPATIGPVYTFVKTDYHGNFKWGVRHRAGTQYAGSYH
ncbi:unnamed protein product [Meganyctiphanes norvegica]|uniref:Uncharacterized protein n=1 Tax=Meganyctiphanes norvegica TaxID=48144 RepID=A0AAV2R303_MEGNR